MNIVKMHQVICLDDIGVAETASLLTRLGVTLEVVPEEQEIPASYWGAPEAGVIGSRLYARGDTPLHSILHTACHIVCMPPERRAALHTDCGGSDLEEAAVCYLQCLLADLIDGFGRDRLFADMDAWGYSFRLGSARAWFAQDAEDARNFLAALPLPSIAATLIPLAR